MLTFTNMKKKYENKIEIPEGVTCLVSGVILNCSKGNTNVSRVINSKGISISTSGKEIILDCKKANKKDIAKIHSQMAHIRNLFLGLKEKFVYELEICNVHFPMTVKIEGKKLVINNFLGEKVPRNANIVEGVDIKIDGSKIKVSSADIEKAGQTAANIEKASRVSNKDRRIFQDGIFITKKPEVVL